MRSKTAPRFPALALLLLGLLPACGGGSGPGGGTGGSGFTFSGPVASFGSIFVNGVELETPPGVVVTIDGSSRELDALDVGMRVRVVGELGEDRLTGRAERIEAVHELRGPVTAAVEGTLPGGALEVLGQRVRLNDTTVFAGLAGPSSLQAGNFVEVSGLRDADGSFRATRLRLAAGSFDGLPEAERELQVKGAVADLTETTFRLAGLTVEYSGDALGPGVGAAGGLAEDLVVEVKSEQPLTASGTLVASRVEAEGAELEPGLQARLWGAVTAFASLAEFSVQGQRVTTTGDTRFRRGTDALENWEVSRLVEVEGQMDGQGVLVAREVSFELARTVKLQGEVEAVTDVGVTVLGVTVAVERSTLVRDKRDGLSPFGLAQLAVGDRVDVRAFLDEDAAVAARLERDDFRTDGRVILQGPASVEGSVLTVLGATVDTADFPAMEFLAADGITPIPFQEFLLEAAGPGRLVKLRGTRTGEGVTWERAEIEVESRFANESGVNEFQFDLSAEG